MPVARHPHLAAGVALLLVAGSLVVAVRAGGGAWPFVAGLCLVAAAAELVAARLPFRLSFSTAVVAAVLAGAAGGPLAAAAVPLVSFTSAWAADPYRLRALLINLAGALVPSVALALVLDGLDRPTTSTSYLLTATLGALAVIAAATAIVASLMALLDGRPLRAVAGAFRPLALASALNALSAGLAVAIWARAGWWSLGVLVLGVVTGAYAVRLVARAQDETRRHAALSWGVLAGLVRAMDRRDRRSARHAAAVAGFSRDLAGELGLGARSGELAHTAGLLHDLGHFALPDRVLDRGAPLTGDDWQGIRLHPEVGADLLRDLGVYGPVAEVVRHHHERIDGRGYPDGLAAERIPLLARVVAVAEAYDAMTAPDTYREPMTSFEALTELRRVAGTQLDERCVEAFARLLAGRDASYRHAADADLDAEVALERRIGEAATAG